MRFDLQPRRGKYFFKEEGRNMLQKRFLRNRFWSMFLPSSLKKYFPLRGCRSNLMDILYDKNRQKSSPFCLSNQAFYIFNSCVNVYISYFHPGRLFCSLKKRVAFICFVLYKIATSP